VTDPLDQPLVIAQPEAHPEPVLTVSQARRMLFISGAIVGVILAVLIGTAGYLFLEAREATRALCTFRDDLANRNDAARQFLDENPDGIVGIPPEEIQASIDARQETIGALAELTCPPRPPRAP
jgi:hypothetical protein